MGLAAISPMSTRGLVRFEDVMLAMDQPRNVSNPYAGFAGLGADPVPDDEATVSDANGNTIYTDWSTRRRYTYDDNGAVQWLDSTATGGGSSTVVNFLNTIFGPNATTTQQYRLPDGTPVSMTGNGNGQVTTSVNNTSKYLLIGAVVFGSIMLLKRG